MKRILTVFAVALLIICTAGCNNNKHSKAYNEAKKILDQVTESVNKAETCDDLDMASWGILGLLGVEGLDALTGDEEKAISELTDKLSAASEKKKAELGCQDEEPYYDDEEVPFDEPVDEAE